MLVTRKRKGLRAKIVGDSVHVTDPKNPKVLLLIMPGMTGYDRWRKTAIEQVEAAKPRQYT